MAILTAEYTALKTKFTSAQANLDVLGCPPPADDIGPLEDQFDTLHANINTKVTTMANNAKQKFGLRSATNFLWNEDVGVTTEGTCNILNNIDSGVGYAIIESALDAIIAATDCSEANSAITALIAGLADNEGALDMFDVSDELQVLEQAYVAAVGMMTSLVGSGQPFFDKVTDCLSVLGQIDAELVVINTETQTALDLIDSGGTNEAALEVARGNVETSFGVPASMAGFNSRITNNPLYTL